MHCEEAIEGEYLAEVFPAMVDVEAVGRKRFLFFGIVCALLFCFREKPLYYSSGA